MIVEKKEHLSLKKLEMSHDILFELEALKVDELKKFDKPRSQIDHAIYAKDKKRIFLKSTEEILEVGESPI